MLRALHLADSARHHLPDLVGIRDAVVFHPAAQTRRRPGTARDHGRIPSLCVVAVGDGRVSPGYDRGRFAARRAARDLGAQSPLPHRRPADPRPPSERRVRDEGGVLLLFPEGTRTTRTPINPLAGSVALIARLANVPVQTLVIETDSPYLSKGWPLFKRPSLPIIYRVRL